MVKWILKELRRLHSNDDGFFGLGPTSGEKSAQLSLADLGKFSQKEGGGDILAAGDFWKSILSGDPKAISRVLGPQISGINKRAQQSKETTAEFGNRGGGTNAAMQMTDANTRGDINSLLSSLTGHAADSLGSFGSSLLSTAGSADKASFEAARSMHQDLLSNILGLGQLALGGATLGVEASG